MNLMLLLVTISAILSAALVDSAALKAFDAKIIEHRERTDSIRTLISSGEDRLTDLAAEESRQLMHLNEIEGLASVSQAYIDTLVAEMQVVKGDLAIIETVVDSLSTSLAERKALMAQRLRRIYATGAPKILAIILGATTTQEVARQLRAMQYLS